jgi:photosystem II stability/assembly factor-like uncharacterized protein
MATAPDDSKRLYAAGYHGLFESRDAGQHWATRKKPDEGSPVVALMPLANGVLLAGTASGMFRSVESEGWSSVSGAGVQSIQKSSGKVVTAVSRGGGMVSVDEGLTWKQCGETDPQGSWYALAFDGLGTVPGQTAQTALAATSTGLFRSTDACRTWTQVRAGLDSETVSLILFHPTRRGEAFVSQGGRIFVSTDGGQRWQPIDDEAGNNAGPSSLIVLSAAPDTLFALFPRRGVYTTGIGFWTTAQGVADSMTTHTGQVGKITNVASSTADD